MAQLFPPAADTIFRLFAACAAVFFLMLALGGWTYAHSSYVTEVGWTRDQPVPFSHKHHVGDDGIDCRYCHSEVEKSARAGLPSTHICMTCHSQLWPEAGVLAPVRQSFASGTPIRWRRVAQLPDYVYFNHSIHIDRGVGCVECHGRIDRMPLTHRAKPFEMRFCLSCHRDPGPHLRPVTQVTRMQPLDWSKAEQRAFAAKAMAAHDIDPAKLDNCGLCHR